MLHKKDPMILRCVREVKMSHELDMSLESDAHPDLKAALCCRTFGATSGKWVPKDCITTIQFLHIPQIIWMGSYCPATGTGIYSDGMNRQSTS